jgi:hypothetical protein
MGLVLKVVAALGLCICAVAAWQSATLSSVKTELASSRAGAGFASFGAPTRLKTSFDASGLTMAPILKPVDTRRFEELGVRGADRRIDLQVRAAQNALPPPRSYPGMPRF